MCLITNILIIGRESMSRLTNTDSADVEIDIMAFQPSFEDMSGELLQYSHVNTAKTVIYAWNVI